MHISMIAVVRRSALVALCVVASSSLGHTQTVLYELGQPGLDAGHSVCAVGDLDGDGVSDLAISYVSGGTLWCNGVSGGVSVFSGRTGQVLHVLASTSSFAGAFGWSVAGAGDVNGDGVPDIIVGAPLWYATGSCGTGEAVVFSGSDGSVLLSIPGTPLAFEEFGYSVSGAGDVNGDGLADLIVGARYGRNYNGLQSGYARVVSGADGSTLYTLYGNNNDDQFGSFVAGVGDITSDGIPDFLVGAPNSHYAGQAGSARTYSGADGLVLQFFNGVGTSMTCAAGDIDGDGVTDMIVGGNPRSGATGALLHDYLGSLVASVGDVDHDGHADVVAKIPAGARIYSGANAATLYQYSTQSSNGPLVAASAGDLNSDGYADVVLAFPSSHVVTVYLSGCPKAQVYCTAKLNSIGCLPAASFEGVPSLSVGLDNFVMRASNVRNTQSGILIWGTSAASVPFGGAIRCVGSPVHRTPVQPSGGNTGTIDCSGTYAFAFTRSFLTSHGIAPGTSVYGQFWSRDPGYSPPNNCGLTDAVSFVVLP
jgi:hypothetical protein